MSFIKKSIALVGTIILTLPNIAFASPTVSVPDFKDKSGNLPWWSDKMSKQFADVLSNELSNAGVSVVERQKLDDVLSAQELAELGIVSKTASNNQIRLGIQTYDKKKYEPYRFLIENYKHLQT